MKGINKLLAVLLLSPLAATASEEVCVYNDNYSGSKFVTYNVSSNKATSDELGVSKQYKVILDNKAVLVIASAKTENGDTHSRPLILTLFNSLPI